MSGGLTQLVAYGAQDMFLTGQPQITFFRVIYKRHTNFAVESMENTFIGSAGFGKKAQIEIVRNGDLITKTYLKVVIPATLLQVNQSSNPNTTFDGKWAWVTKLGHAIINSIEFTIGGGQIDKHYGDWLNIWYELARNFAQDRGYDKMIGNYPELTRLSTTHPAATLYIPLQFYFNRNDGLALPLIALQYHDVRLNFEFNSLEECIVYNGSTLPSQLRQTQFDYASVFVDYVFLDNIERKHFAQESHEYLIEQLQFTGAESARQTSLSTQLQFNHPVKTLYWAIKLDKYTSGRQFLAYDVVQENMNLMASKRFVLRCAQYDTTKNPTELAIDAFGRVEINRLIPNNSFLRAIFLRLDAVVGNAANLTVKNVSVTGDLLTIQELSMPTSEMFNNVPLDIPETSDGHPKYDVTIRQFDNYGLYLNRTGNPVKEALIQLNGHDRFTKRDGNYFNYVQPYQHYTNTPSDGINIYSFALTPENHQPSGTCNMSRIDKSILQLTLDSEITKADNKLFIYAVNYNVLRIMGGMGGVAFAN